MFSPVTFLRSSMRQRSYYKPPTTRIFDQFIDTGGLNLPAHTPSPTNAPGGAWNTAGAGFYVIDASGTGAHGQFGDARCAWIEGVISDGVVTMTEDFSAFGYNFYTGPVGRVQAINSFWLAGINPAADRLAIIEVNAGVETERAGTSVVINVNTTYTTSLTMSGTSLTAQVGSTQVSYTSSLWQTNTKHGIRNLRGDIAGNITSFRLVG